MFTGRLQLFPVAVCIFGSIECIPYIDKDELFRMDALYCGTDLYSGYEVYLDMLTGKLYATDRL